MTLGLAAILIFVLYLVDKHSRWKQAFKFLCWTVGLAVVGFGLFYTFSLYSDLHINHSHPKLIPVPANPNASNNGQKPIWIYVDLLQEFNGSPAGPPPKVPSQISYLLNKNEDCEPGSYTFGNDKMEWVCVKWHEVPTGLPAGAILQPARERVNP
jgi:hypothetical protein